MTATFDEIENEVRKLAELTPDYVYPYVHLQVECYYQTEGEPQCIFGKALSNLGIELEPHHEGASIQAVLNDIDIYVNPEKEAWAAHVQLHQDQGIPWAEAVSIADVAFSNKS